MVNRDFLVEAIENLKKYNGKPVKIMEVCGTHTMSIFKHGIRGMLSEKIKLISGPGCPVCVTPQSYLDNAMKLSGLPDTIIVSFGDMLKVPGTNTTLEEMKALGEDIRIVYSPLDCINICVQNPEKKIIFLAVGFETTIPVIALTIKKAEELGVNNFFILCGLKSVIPALNQLCLDRELDIDGFLLPGHVSAIIGAKYYTFLSEEYNKACVIAGFEADEIVFAINLILKQIAQNKKGIENAYPNIVKRIGNDKAYEFIYEVFEPIESLWRGIGTIQNSGFKLREKYSSYDARNIIKLSEEYEAVTKGCMCGEIIKGTKNPYECTLFGKQCTPLHPIGACMVSSEGTCAAYYKYEE